jgi:hypothetical protein
MTAPDSSAIRETDRRFRIGMIPGMIGIVQPRARTRSTSSKYGSGAKNSWVTAKSAPAAALAARISASSASEPDAGFFSGKAATPMPKSPSERTSRTRSTACSKPPGVGTQGARGPSGGSPRSAMTLRTPAARWAPMIERSSSTVCPTQVRWAIGVSVVSRAIRAVIAAVRSRVEPPAPYVTDTKPGFNGSSSRIDCHSTRSPAASFGGKNSKENDLCPRASACPMCSVALGRREGTPRAMRRGYGARLGR